MPKTLKILFASLVLAALVFLIFVLSTEMLLDYNKRYESDIALEQNRINKQMKEIEENYKKGVNQVLAEYFEIIGQEDILVSQVKAAKDELLVLKMPAEYKDLHFNLVLAMNKMENYLTNDDAREKIASQQLITDARANHEWLNR